MRTTERHCRCDSRMPQQNLINFVRRDILASTDDDVLDSSGQMQVAVCVKESFVAGPKPSIHKSAGVGVGIVCIPAKHAGALYRHFAALVGAEMAARLVHDTEA